MLRKILVISCLPIVLISCRFNDSFDHDLLIDFKKFQTIVEEHPQELKGKYFDVADDYHWIVESNFERLFSFLNQDDKERFLSMLESGKVKRIEVKSLRFIKFKIRPNYNNYLLNKEWKELWIVYDGTDQKLTIEDLEKGEELIMIEENWFKWIIKEQRYIGG